MKRPTPASRERAVEMLMSLLVLTLIATFIGGIWILDMLFGWSRSRSDVADVKRRREDQ